MKEADDEVVMHVAEDRMSVRVACRVSTGTAEAVLARIRGEIRKLDLDEKNLRIDLEEWLRGAATESPRVIHTALFQGREPVPPRDGCLEWARPFFRRRQYVDPETGVIDYRRRITEDEVEENERLARVVPPVEGKDGVDAFGVHLKTDRAKRARIFRGRNVQLDEDGWYRATKRGLVRWSDDRLSVEDVLHVDGDVGMGTGNIRHSGTVMIEGDILAGSKVEATGDVEVRGVVEVSDVRAGGNLVVCGGITGAEGHRVRVEGSLSAKYILKADVEAGGDVVVEGEIVQSKVKARGLVKIVKGRIVGGKVTARKGIVAGRLGSGAAVKTILTAGVDFALSAGSNQRIASVLELQEERERIRGAIERVLASGGAISREREGHLERLRAMLEKVETELGRGRDALASADRDSIEEVRYRVLANTQVFPNARIRLRSACLHVQEGRNGPVEAVLHRGRVVLESCAKGGGRKGRAR